MLKFVVADFVAFLVFAVLIVVLLDGVVGEVDQQICGSFEGEVSRGCPDVSLREPVSFEYTVEGGQQKEVPDIKFTIFIEKRSFHIFLNDKSPKRSITIFLTRFDSKSYLFETITNCDTLTSIAILARFHDP